VEGSEIRYNVQNIKIIKKTRNKAETPFITSSTTNFDHKSLIEKAEKQKSIFVNKKSRPVIKIGGKKSQIIMKSRNAKNQGGFPT
jgi:hypothetical protein